MIKRAVLLAALLSSIPSLVFGQAALRPDQVAPGTPDITWQRVGNQYQIGTTIPWVTVPGANPSFTVAAHNGRVVDLTANGPIAGTLPVPINGPATASAFGDGAGFTIQVRAFPLTLSAGTATINGQTQIIVGPYQSVGLSAKGGNWFANFSLPQPSAQTGETRLGDDMHWHAETALPPATLPPVIQPPLTLSCTVGVFCTYTINASNHPLISRTATGLPAGFSPVPPLSGVISGTPALGTDAASPYNVTITATNAISTDTQTLVLTVNATVTPPSGLTEWNAANADLVNGEIDATDKYIFRHKNLSTSETAAVVFAGPITAGRRQVFGVGSFFSQGLNGVSIGLGTTAVPIDTTGNSYLGGNTAGYGATFGIGASGAMTYNGAAVPGAALPAISNSQKWCIALDEPTHMFWVWNESNPTQWYGPAGPGANPDSGTGGFSLVGANFGGNGTTSPFTQAPLIAAANVWGWNGISTHAEAHFFPRCTGAPSITTFTTEWGVTGLIAPIGRRLPGTQQIPAESRRRY